MDIDPADYPPTTFHYPGHVFRPGIPYQARPGLLDRVEQLTVARRYRSALQPLLAILGEQPNDQEALTLALLVVGRSRTEQVQAEEAIGPRQLYDRRLDPIFAVCSQCRRTSWTPHNCLFGKAARIVNPAGAQCRGCGYVVCRNCLKGRNACPNCGSGALNPLVYPTGRTPKQLERRSQPVAAAIILREGPIAPDQEWITDLLDLISPDVLEGSARLKAYPCDPWPDDAGNIAAALAARLAGEGRLGGAKLEGWIGNEIRTVDGLRAYILKLYA